MDDIIVFRKLEKKDLLAIVDIELEKLRKRLESRGLILHMAEEAKEFIVGKGNATEYGARPLRRAVERFLEDPLSEALLRGEFGEASGISVTSGEGKLVLSPIPKENHKTDGEGKKK